MARKRYIPGSELTPGELNEYQDDYINDAYEPWRTIGSCSALEFPSLSARTTYGAPTPWRNPTYTVATAFQKAARLDPADYANSYNGSLRTRQCRLVAIIRTDTVAIGDRLNTISLKSVASSATINTWTFGSALGTITVPTLSVPSTTTRIEGSAFTFPSAGMYAIEVAARAQGSAPSNIGVMVHVLLQTRAT